MADRVMVRAFKNQPVVLAAVAVHGNRFEVANPQDLTKSIIFPYGDVYLYSDDLFVELKTAYEQGRADQLATLWSRAEPYTPEHFRRTGGCHEP